MGNKEFDRQKQQDQQKQQPQAGQQQQSGGRRNEDEVGEPVQLNEDKPKEEGQPHDKPGATGKR
ncbi:MAG: hypothetical protein FJZ38_19930 [Candidatus Rokubacteria bacterium]|nr:hypothetical protein [Candidatus Rokubacteria bacterium]